jgi:DNA-binding PadR family transcriptional regulator
LAAGSRQFSGKWDRRQDRRRYVVAGVQVRSDTFVWPELHRVRHSHVAHPFVPPQLTWERRFVYSDYRYRMSIQKNDFDDRFRDLYSGLIRLHILHHAVEEPIFGLEMAEELARHGYRISLGTLYPLLHGMEKRGYLRSAEKRNGQSIRKVYRATPLGKKALKAMRVKVHELLGELNEAD